MTSVVDEFTSEYLKDDLPELAVGDSVEVGVWIIKTEVDGKTGVATTSKERVQKFSGTLIAMNGRGITSTITVRRIVQSEGVECVFPLHSQLVHSVEVTRHGRVRRSKLYYLRDRVGKRVKLKERRPAASTKKAKKG